MNIKSLLGSAAAIFAVSGAHAADAVVIAEPEPMEYVRICDTYGTGFYYIPGTETCLKVGGYIRYDIGVGGPVRYGNSGEDLDGDGDADTYYKRARARLSMDARSETELGTLRGAMNLNFQYTTSGGSANNPSDSFSIDSAFIELGGFRIGKADSIFSTFLGGPPVMSDDLMVPYGPFGTHQISYTFKADGGFSAVVGVEEGRSTYGNYVIRDYMPHVVAGALWKQDWGSIGAMAGYDSVTEEGAFKARLDVKATDQLSLFVMAGYSTNDRAGVLGNATSNNFYAQWNGDYAVWAGGTFKVNKKLSLAGVVAYDEDENFAAILDAPYELVPNFRITPEIHYTDNFSVNNGDKWGGFLRFQRSF